MVFLKFYYQYGKELCPDIYDIKFKVDYQVKNGSRFSYLGIFWVA